VPLALTAERGAVPVDLALVRNPEEAHLVEAATVPFPYEPTEGRGMTETVLTAGPVGATLAPSTEELPTALTPVASDPAVTVTVEAAAVTVTVAAPAPPTVTVTVDAGGAQEHTSAEPPGVEPEPEVPDPELPGVEPEPEVPDPVGDTPEGAGADSPEREVAPEATDDGTAETVTNLVAVWVPEMMVVREVVNPPVTGAVVSAVEASLVTNEVGITVLVL